MEFQKNTALAPPTDERIRWFETTYRVTLPADYVAALKTGNGAVLSQRHFRQRQRERLVERMLCLLARPQDDEVNGWYDISVVLSELDSRLIDDDNLIGMNVIPIAALFAGDFVCLDFRHEPQSPIVAVWDHELSDDLSPTLEPVAASFTAFEEMLY